MKTNLKTCVLSLFLLTTFGFKLGDEIELKKFVNARSNPNFLKRTNIVKTLAKGTTGSIVDYKKFSSGNYGLKIKISSGKNINKSYWVYYNVNEPLITIKNNKKEVQPEEVNNEVLENPDTTAKTDEEMTSYADPNEVVLTDLADVPNIVNDSVRELNQNLSADCLPEQKTENAQEEKADLSDETIELVDVDLGGQKIHEKTEIVLERPEGQSSQSQKNITTIEERNYNETMSIAPFRARPLHQIENRSLQNNCISRSSAASYITCVKNGEVNGFMLENNGPNAIVSKYSFGVKRVFNFNNMDRAQSDMRLEIEDYPSDFTPASTSNVYMFFPRKVLPSIKQEGNETIVTLATNETVRFNSQTKEIVGGALNESKMATLQNGRAKPAGISYTGEGVVIKASKNNGQPFGSDQSYGGKITKDNTMATISKKGHKDCQVSANSLWTLNTTSNEFSIKNEYATDEGLDKLLKEKCGFSIN